jgi:hypothetical protein
MLRFTESDGTDHRWTVGQPNMARPRQEIMEQPWQDMVAQPWQEN